MFTQITRPRIITSTLAVLFVVFFSFTIVHAGGGGSSDSGSSSGGSSSSGSSGSSYNSTGSGSDSSGFTDALTRNSSANGSNITSFNTFSSGNVGITVGSNCTTCNSSTAFYSNGNGTYNTITTYTNNGGTQGGGLAQTSGGGNNGSSNPGNPGASAGSSNSNPTSCPAGYTLYQNQCYPSNQCRTVSSGKGGSSTSCSGSNAPQNNILSGGHGHRQGTGQGNTTTTSVAPSVTISAIPSIVRSGGATTLSWNGGSATACTISGTDGFLSHAITGSSAISNVTEERTYTITCVSGSASATAQTTVRIVPVWREF